jgi:hypothetical protein
MALLKKMGLLMAAGLLLAGIAGCKKKEEGPAETLGKQIDQGIEKMGKEGEKAGEKVAQELEKAGEQIKDATAKK